MSTDPHNHESRHEPLRLIQLTDTHLYADPATTLKGFHTEDLLVRTLDAAARDRAVDLLLLTGDLVHDGSPAGYRRLLEHVRRSGLSACALPGNHDDPDAMAAAFRAGPVTWQPFLDRKGWRLVFLSSWVPGHEHGLLGDEELERLDTLLAQAPHLHALIVIHHQPVPVGSRWIDAIGLHRAHGLWTVLDRHAQVRGVLWGHVHQEYSGRRGGVRLLGSPSTCMQFLPAAEHFALDEQGPGYRWLELDQAGEIATGVVWL